jgi:hypothetical protein
MEIQKGQKMINLIQNTNNWWSLQEIAGVFCWR